MITAAELAKNLGISRQRVHQYVQAGKLDGCFSGDGPLRRFDLAKSAEALGKRLDPGQLMGNGAATKAAIRDLSAASTTATADDLAAPSEMRVPASIDPDSYEAVRIQKAQEETRRLRRINAESEGRYVLATEAAGATKRLLAQEIARFEMALKNGSRMTADKLGVDFKTVRQIMMEAWRSHRTERSAALEIEAGRAEPTEAELAEDI